MDLNEGGDEGESEDIPKFNYGQWEFSEQSELRQLISALTEEAVDDVVKREVAYEKFVKIVDHYQEQPQVLDPYLEEFIGSLLTKGRDRSNSNLLTNQAFSYIYLIIKVRGHKVVVRYFPHEVQDLAPILTFLEEQSASRSLSWQTRYVLLLWLSILVKIPFDLTRFDASPLVTASSTSDRILAVGRAFLWSHDVSRDAAAFMLSQFLTRPDVQSQHLSSFVAWALDHLPPSPTSDTFQSAAELAALHGTLSALALIFKHGTRHALLHIAARVLRKLLDVFTHPHPVPTVRRLATKIVNRIGLVFLPVRIAKWRYQRGARSLAENLGQGGSTSECVNAQRTSSTKNPNVSIGPLARPFARSLAPLTHSLVPHYSLRSRARFAHSFARGKVNDWMAIYSVFFSILAHSA